MGKPNWYYYSIGGVECPGRNVKLSFSFIVMPAAPSPRPALIPCVASKGKHFSSCRHEQICTAACTMSEDLPFSHKYRHSLSLCSRKPAACRPGSRARSTRKDLLLLLSPDASAGNQCDMHRKAPRLSFRTLLQYHQLFF